MANDLLLMGVGQAAGAAAFDPGSLSPALWLKADVGTFQTSGGSPAVADADPVGEWRDQSGNNRHLAQATGSVRGTLKLAIINGLPVIRFDGTDDFYTVTGLTTGVAQVWAVLKAPGTTWNGYGSLLGGLTEAWRWPLMESGGTTFHSNPFPSAAMKNGSALSSPFSMAPINTAFVVAYTVANPEYDVARGVGRFDTHRLAMDLGELLAFSSVLGGTDEANLLTYLRGRWGTP